MLHDLAQCVEVSKLNDLRARLENKRVDQVLPAELELGVVWALSKMGDVEVEPDWYGARRPDAYTERLFEGYACAVEITAISDARLAQEDDMRRVATRLCEVANKIRKGQGKHLHFHFGEESGHTSTGYLRWRNIDRDFVPTEATTELIRTWLQQGGEKPPLQVIQGKTSIAIAWSVTPQHPHSNFFSSMPAEAYSLENNPLHEALEEKSKQLASPNFEGLRCVVVADAGSRMLRHLNESMRSPGTVTGNQVIVHFLGKADSAVDVVLALSPYRAPSLFGLQLKPLSWRSSLWVRSGLHVDPCGVGTLVALLPPPRFEGYQARSLQQQAAFRQDALGWYLGKTIESGTTGMTIKISARAFLDLLAGRITLEQFHHFSGLENGSTKRNIFAHRLDQGDTLSSVKIEHGGLDEDDDWLVIDLQQDPSAGPLKLSDAPSTSH